MRFRMRIRNTTVVAGASMQILPCVPQLWKWPGRHMVAYLNSGSGPAGTWWHTSTLEVARPAHGGIPQLWKWPGRHMVAYLNSGSGPAGTTRAGGL
jgi:hypothetical protein